MKLIRKLIDSAPIDFTADFACIGFFACLIGGYRSGSCRTGLATVFRDPDPIATHGIQKAGKLTGESMKALAERALSKSLIEASIGMAALNALLIDPDNHYANLSAQEILFQEGAGKRVAVVGAFPFLEENASHFQSLSIIQEEPENGRRGVEKARRIFPEMDMILITASSFINHTFEDLLDYAGKIPLIVAGPTTPLSKTLFDYPIRHLSGMIVEDLNLALKYCSQGASFRQMKGIKKVTLSKFVI